MTEEIIKIGLEKIKGKEEFALHYAIEKEIDGNIIIEDGIAVIPDEMSKEKAIKLIKKNQGFPL